MIELFTNVSDTDKEFAKFAVDIAFQQSTIPKIMDNIKNYRALCSPEVQEFIDFYVHLKMEEIKNEKSNSN